MPPRVRLLFSIMSLSLFMVAFVPLVVGLNQRSDIWWTPKEMLVPLNGGTDQVEIYVRGKPLATVLQAGELRIADEGGSTPLTAEDFGLRLNNWDRVRVMQLPLILTRASACGALACLFLLIVTGRLAYRGEREP